jgi:CRP-like cAMP-binding protein
MTIEDKHVRKLREKLEVALTKRKDDDALKLLGELVEADPKAPRWPHKRGELYRKKNHKSEAIACYALAATLYSEQGFLARAVAMAKTVIDIDSKRIDVLERIYPEAARNLHRQQQRPAGLSIRPSAHPAVRPDRPPAPPPRHAAVLPDSAPAPASHAAILPESAPPARAADPRKRQQGRAPAAAAPEAPPVSPPRARQAEPTADAEALRLPAPPRLPDLSVSVLDIADELTIAPDVSPNETRFSNAPSAPGIRPNLTDRELEPRQPAPPKGSARPKAPGARTLSNLPLFPLFAELPQEALMELIKGAEVVELDDGATVVRTGEPADALYGIVEGSVEIAIAGKPLRITLAEGDVFGESCLLAGEKRSADVIVRGHLVALKIPRPVFNLVLAAYPRLAEVLLELLTRRLLGNLLQSSPLFQEFDARGRQELAQLFEIRRAPRGMILAEIGKLMDGLYINLTGALEVSHADGRAPERHEPGTMFGQSSLLTQDPSAVGVRALANMLVLRLPSRAFHNIAMQYPALLAHVSELSGSSVAKVTT